MNKIRSDIACAVTARTGQVAALCWRRNKAGRLRILLITSRDTGRWVIPKGWPIHGRPGHEAAATEAWEEAGVVGRAEAEAIGSYDYDKIMNDGTALPCTVTVYRLAVQRRTKSFPEAGKRRVRWLRPAKAARLVDEPQLAALLAGFAVDGGPAAEPDGAAGDA
jgi:8-oxo-dGTP pyrophosphatase MutT (NUDIX family)